MPLLNGFLVPEALFLFFSLFMTLTFVLLFHVMHICFVTLLLHITNVSYVFCEFAPFSPDELVFVNSMLSMHEVCLQQFAPH